MNIDSPTTVGVQDSIYDLTTDPNISHNFVVGDVIRAQRFITGNTYLVEMVVTNVSGNNTVHCILTDLIGM
jgi:hypothetical protein